MELSESSALSGEPFELHVTTSADKCSVKFPDNVLVAFDGIFRNETYYNFTGSSATITVFIPPSVSVMPVEIHSGPVLETFELTVSRGDNPLVSGESFYDHEVYMARNFNNRDVGTLQMRRASEHYQSYFTQLGYEAEIRTYQKSDGFRTYEVRDVIAYKWGTVHPDEWIIIGGHYDIARRSIEGALDNTAGACAVVELAEGMANLKTDRTIVFGLWDGEEQGLWGSSSFANEIPPHVDIKTNINFDMVGLNWPLQWDLAVRIGPDTDTEVVDCPELHNATMDAWIKYLDYPEDGMNIRETTGGGSDHTSFQRLGVQTFFIICTADYIQYHRRTDLVVDMVAYAGGQTELESGFNSVAWLGLYLTLLMDNNNALHQLKETE
ncbi:MAG: M28 family peptidase [Thermoplasmata archaeon]|nr:MAG: M28 family peptidase [Thermoplasmata archaeon]